MFTSRANLCIDACAGVSNADLAGLSVKHLLETDAWLLNQLSQLKAEAAESVKKNQT